MIHILLLLAGGLTFLILGADQLVKHSSQLAARLGISSLVIGLTIVAYGTSAPELIVSTQAALNHQPDISLGNIIGSNIANVLLILGVCALILPLKVSQQIARLDVPIMIGVSVLLFVMCLDGNLGKWDACILFSGIVLYTWFVIWMSKRESKPIQDEYDQEFGKKALTAKQVNIPKKIFMIAVALVIVILGARWFVEGAVQIARHFGMSELVIGLTIVAIGTGLPEIATSIVATLRGERDIAVANIVGSNIYNILAILGIAGFLTPNGISVSPALINFDILVMIATAVACFPIFYTGHLIARWEGLLFLLYYIAYTIYLIFQSTQHDALEYFSEAMLWFVMPLTVVTVCVLFVRSLRKEQINK